MTAAAQQWSTSAKLIGQLGLSVQVQHQLTKQRKSQRQNSPSRQFWMFQANIAKQFTTDIWPESCSFDAKRQDMVQRALQTRPDRQRIYHT